MGTLRRKPLAAFAPMMALLVVTLLGLPAPAGAQAGTRWALLIGVDDYEKVTDLRYAVADVKAVGSALLRLGYAHNQVVVMTSDRSDDDRPTSANVLGRIKQLAGQMGPEDTLLVYFSGHGFSQKSTGNDQYLATVDTDLGRLKATSLPLSLLRDTIARSPLRQVFFIIDACRDIPNPKSTAGPTRLVSRPSEAGIRRLTEVPAARDLEIVALSSCKDGQISEEQADLGHGVFTYFLLQGLQGRAKNEKKQITVALLCDYVFDKVKEWSAGRQTPWILQSGAAQIVLADNVARDALYLANRGKDAAGSEFQSGKVTLGAQKTTLDRSITFTDTLRFDLDGAYDYFEARVGLSSFTRARGNVARCTVLLDGKPETVIVLGGAEPEPIPVSVEVAGKRRLELRVEPEAGARGQSLRDTVWWGEACLTNEPTLRKPATADLAQVNVNFTPDPALNVSEWDLLVDDALKRDGSSDQSANATVNVARGPHTFIVRWRGRGYSFDITVPITDERIEKTLFTDQSVRFTVGVDKAALDVQVTAKILSRTPPRGILGGILKGVTPPPELKVEATVAGARVPVQKL